MSDQRIKGTEQLVQKKDKNGYNYHDVYHYG